MLKFAVEFTELVTKLDKLIMSISKEDLLMRRMVWRNLHNLDYRNPESYRDVRDNAIAVKLLTCIGCIDYVMMYIEDDLTDMGKFKHNVKRVHRMYTDNVVAAHNEAFRLLKVANPKASTQYNDYVDYYFHRIWDSVALEGIEKSMNVLYSLSRLVAKYNDIIKGRYDFAPGRRLEGAFERFKELKIKDYSLDFLIENAINSKMDK